ncbi:MAG TPA: tetratricopeptide repeat protein, partial [Aggregatilineales bacterium]|nr:tetratricopeptide repeat protein [Aggregatilineales bacterium]
CNAVIGLLPRNDIGYFWRGKCLMAQGKFRRATANFNRAIALNPQSLSAYMERGGTFLGRRRYQLAFADFEYILNHYPDLHIAYVGRGMAYLLKGVYERRIHSYAGVIDYRYGVAEFNQAIADFNHVMQKYPHMAEIYYGLGILHSENQNYASALVNYTHALTLGGNSIPKDSILNHRALTHFKVGDYDSAVADLDEAITINPNNRLVKRNLGHILREMERMKVVQPTPN